jgi:protein MpaA
MLRLIVSVLLAAAVGCGPADEPDPIRLQPNNVATNGSSNGATNGRPNGQSNGQPNGQTNGATNGETNNVVPLEPRAWRIGGSVLDRSLIVEQYGDEGPVMLVFAAIHGNERPAVTFGERWRVMLQGGLAQRAGIRVVFVPWANPDGIAASSRQNANDIDLNRNFPSDNFMPGGPGGDEPLSEPESRALKMVIDAVQPAAVISVHCCVPTFDYDGPGEDLADSMAQAMNPDIRFPVVRLGSQPSSMGSYVGIELGLPIITLEFQDDSIDTEDQLQNVERAMTAAADWVALNGDDPDIVIADALDAMPSAEFQPFVYGRSAGGLSLRGDDFLDGEDRVLVVSGLTDNDRRSLHIAEHIRRVLLSEIADDAVPVTLVTAPNPDGIVEGVTTNADGDSVVDLDVHTPETDALLDFIEARPPALSVVIEADDESDNVTAWQIELGQIGAYAPAEWALLPNDERRSPLISELREHAPVIRIGVQTMYAEGNGTPASASPAPVSEFVRDVAVRFGPE